MKTDDLQSTMYYVPNIPGGGGGEGVCGGAPGVFQGGYLNIRYRDGWVLIMSYRVSMMRRTKSNRQKSFSYRPST